ncbi:MAG: LysE family transporter [Verrucomicrobia bacterium]|jgi:threonine/homoserine/homoserine lactone efflux protein|nr:LysE family transporter [Verrucomicrobiota bacterium]
MELLLTVATVHLLACLSPGPDILLVVRTALRHGRMAAIRTTLGILSGVSVHIGFGLAGISYLIAQSEKLKALLALAGGAYLLYLGIAGWLASRSTSGRMSQLPPGSEPSFRQGLLVNLLNVKALLFFLSLFSVLLGPEIPLGTKILAGGTMIGVQLIAFSTVAILADRPGFRTAWPKLQNWLDAGISLVFLIIGLWIWISTIASLAA